MSFNDSDDGSAASSTSRKSFMSSGLSALTNTMDVEPLIDVWKSDFADEFALDDDDPFWSLVREEELEIDNLGDIGGQDFIDIIEAFLQDRPIVENIDKQDVVYNSFPYVNIPSGTKKQEPLPNLQPNFSANGIIAVVGSTDVCCYCDELKIVVGHKKPSIEFNITVEDNDYFAIANMYSEEIGGKGVGLGFSNFYHSVAIMILAKNTDGVIEPHDGFDYAFDGITVEVTGLNWSIRDTFADVVIGKYELIGYLQKNKPYQSLYTDWSWREDVGLINAYKGTAFDYEHTDRSNIVSLIADELPKITKAQRISLGKNYLSYCSKRPVIDKNVVSKNRNFDSVRDSVERCITAGSKIRDGLYYVPAPFRVLYPIEEPDYLTHDETIRRIETRIFTTDYVQSTYHTWKTEWDPRGICASKMINWPEKKTHSRESINDILYHKFKEYKSFCSATIQSALLPKIFAKSGCFYDIYNRIGISWNRKKASSLTWDCIYYSFTNPGEEVEIGKWGYNSMKGVYVSPTFKVSRQDIHYAQVLPAKIVACLSSCRPLLTPSDYNAVEKIIMMTICIQSNSTWMTSYRSGANRFMTCCHMSDSGDIPALIAGQLSKEKFHRFSDYLLLKLMIHYIDEKPSTNQTPLFRLPISIMSYEKDFSQTLQWHMRETDHSTNCMIKVTNAAREHLLEEEETNDWMKLQLDFLKKMQSKGCTSIEFESLMNSAPNFPTLNIVMFIGMCNIVNEEILDIGSVQHSMGFAVWNMMTDRHCTEFVGKTPSGIPILKTSKVVEAMSKYLHSLGGVTGGYELIAKMAIGPKLPDNYLLNHYKDAKESEREISQMFPQHRIKQCLPEVLAETFTGNNESDQMSDPSKYSKHVSDTMDPNSVGRSFHASEDRSAFCQSQEPQLQALSLAIISYEANSTSLRTAAAMTLMNKTRTVVYPPDADHEMLLKDMTTGTAIISDGKAKQITRTLKIEKNMTQGLGAVTAGAINTIYVTSHAKIATKLIDGLHNTAIRTTSDDVKRSAYYDGKYNRESVAAAFYHMPNENLNMCMMVNNKKKFMTSEKMSEFNNVVATVTGMIPQSPIFATLCVQPLLSKSLFGDIVTVVNTSRSTMSWGCPPDTMQSSLDAMIKVLRQKWLLTDDDMDAIWSARLLPTKIEEHISGFWIRNDKVLASVFGSFSDADKNSILEGQIPLYDMLKRAELDLGKKKKKRRMKHTPIEGLNRANEVADTIMAQRYTSERLMSRHVQPIKPDDRRSAKNKFMQLINMVDNSTDISKLKLLEPPRVSITVRATRRFDRYPTSIGTSAQIDTISIKRIRACRMLKVKYRDHPTKDEVNIASLPDDEYKQQMARLERMKHYEGLSYKSPVGLPITRIYDNNIYSRPASFNFTVNMESRPKIEQPFTYRGVVVNKFRPVIYGSDSISQISEKRGYVLAFGIGMLRDKLVAFYQTNKKQAEIIAMPINKQSKRLTFQTHNNLKVYLRTTLDVSPLLLSDASPDYKPHLPGLIGDNEAISNYAFFTRSNQPSGFAIYRKMFEKKHSKIPYFMIKHMPQYPFFPYRDDSTVLPQGRITAFVGYASISRLKLEIVEIPERLIRIDLTQTLPVRMMDTLVEEIVDFDYWDIEE